MIVDVYCPQHACPQRECLHPPIPNEPARECDRCDGGAAYVSPILLIVGISALGYVAIGATLIVLGGLAWHTARALLGG